MTDRLEDEASPMTRSVIAAVTVVIPTYNRRPGLSRCLDALLRCDTGGRSVRVVVVEDGSQSGARETVTDLGGQVLAGWTLHYHWQENRGQSAARNAGVTLADTELVLFLDDDCEPHPGWLLGLVEGPWDEDLGGLGGRLLPAEGKSWVARYCRFVRYNEYPPDDGPIRFLNSACCAYRRSALMDVGGYEERLTRGVDHDLGWRLQVAGYRLGFAPAAAAIHHHRELYGELVRDYWRRGHTNALRAVMWDRRPPPDAATIRRETCDTLLLAPDLFIIPFDALKLISQGVALRDALPFAWLRWRLRWAARWGRVAMLKLLVAGGVSTDRSTRLLRDEQGHVRTPEWMARTMAEE